MVPGEHTVGQRWLMVQLAVGSQRKEEPKNRIPDWTGPFIGNHDGDAFYVTEQTMSFRTFDLMLRTP